MPARLFRRIQSSFSRLNKTVLLVLFSVAIVVSGAKTTLAAAPDLDYKYADYINNFSTSNDGTTVSGLTGGTVQNSTSNNDAVGLVFNVNLGINTPTTGDTIKAHWDRVDQSYSDTNGNYFLIELCNNQSATQCWLSSVPFIPGKTSTNDNYQNLISPKDSSGNDADSEQVAVNAFTATGAGNTTNHLNIYNPSTDTVTPVGTITLTKGASLTASLWYCATGTGKGAAADYTKASATNSTTSDKQTRGAPTDFGGLCGGSSYFQIGAPLGITIPTDATALQQQVNTSQQTLATPAKATSSDINLPVCNVTPVGGGTINGCIAMVTYYIYQATAWIAGLFGNLFDFFIGYSLSDASYRYAFAVTGWKLVRDISNIFFIIIMVYTGFSAVFSASSASMKKVVPQLIINAILINFSLFATRVVIDISNITARMFYSEMLVCDQSTMNSNGGVCSAAQAKRGEGGYWPLSEKIVSSFNPQQIFKTNVLTPSTVTNNSVTSVSSTNVGTAAATNERDYADYFAIVCLIASFIMIAVSIMFFKVAFLFIGRVVGLYICMVFSPFAFLSRDMPMLGSIPRLKWKDWTKELTSYALLGPVFIFFLYIIYTFLSSNFVQQIGIQAMASSGFFATVMAIAIPMLIIFFFMQAAQKAAEGLSGDIGKAVQGIGSTVTGLAVGAATGGASFLGSNTIGRLANNAANSEGFKDWASKNGIIGRTALKSINSIGKSSFDARNTTIGKGAAKQLGINTDQKALGLLNLDTKSTKGGYEQAQADKIKGAEEYKKLFTTKRSDDEIKGSYSQKQLAVRQAYDTKQDNLLKARWIRQVTKDPSVAADPTKYNDTAWAAHKKANKDGAYDKEKNAYQKEVPQPPVYYTATEANKARSNSYAEHKEKKSGGSFAQQNYYNKTGQLVAKKGDVMRNPYATEDYYDKDGEEGGNKLASKGDKVARKNAWQAIAEASEGAAKGAATGALIGSVVPIVGTAAGAVVGGTLGAIRQTLRYSGVTNKKIGGAIRAEPKKKDKIIDDLLKEVKKDADAAAPAPETPPAAAAGGTPPPATP